MTEDYKATPEQWAHQETWIGQNDADAACLLELRSRVKALEEAEKDRVFAASVEALDEAENDRRFEAAKALIDKSAPAPAGTLVDRVAATLHAATNSDPNVPANEWTPEARAAIREVATWLRLERQSPMTADVLEQEADRG
jgi:hypothetical protein